MKNIFRILFLSLISLFITEVSLSKEQILNTKNSSTIKATAAGCTAASGYRFLDINNVRARINTGGDMWWDLSALPQYFIPKGGTATSMFSGSLWVGGLDVNNQLKLAAIRYRQVGNDYWPGPLTTDGTASVDQETCVNYDKHFLITRADVDKFLEWWNSDNKAVDFPGYTIPKSITDWPAHGDVAKGQSFYLAPFYDNDGDGYYDPTQGDYPYYDLDNSLCPPKDPDPNFVPERTMEENLTEYKVPLVGSILSDQVIKGDQTLWWVFNDKGNNHTETQGAPIGMEIRAQAFAFATNDVINNMTFYSYEIINRSTFELTKTFFSPWVDTDLGYAWDDYVGCDVLRGLGYCYNGKPVDGNGEPEAYGAQPPAVGVDFFQGPYIDPDHFDNPKFEGDCSTLTNGPNFAVDQMAINGINFGNGIVDDERYGMRRFVYHNNTSPDQATTDPTIAPEYYNFLRGIWKDNNPMQYGGDAHLSGTVGPVCDFMFPGDSDPCNWGTNFQPPGGGYNTNGKFWTEESAGNLPGDRRFMQSAGPFTLKSGAVNYITVGIPWARASAGGPWASVELLRSVDDKCQSLFNNCFKVIDGPNAPDLVFQEMDRQFIVYITNSSTSNNYQESYAEIDPSIDQPNPADHTKRSDSTFRFEGYQIFQLKDATVTLGDAKDAYGNYNPDLVRQVAQFDIKNGVGRIINFNLDPNIGFVVPTVEVEGGDEGIRHSFVLTEDAFATGDRRLKNHKQYYYTALAYAYNNYLTYDPGDPIKKLGQPKPYLPGRKKNHELYTAIPHIIVNGTVMNSSYGDGPTVTRIEGHGNGGKIIDLTQETVDEILSKPPASSIVDGDSVVYGDPLYPIAYEAKYKQDFGPLNVKIIDPLKVKNGKYILSFDTLMITKNFNVSTSGASVLPGGDTASIVTGTWKLTNEQTGEVFPSDFAIDKQNEQLFLDLGISVNMKAIYYPGPYKIGEVVGQNNTTVSQYEVLADNNDFLESSLTYANGDTATQWLGGVHDNNIPSSPLNWIRAGTYKGDAKSSDYDMVNVPKPYDPGEFYEKVIDGTWAPAILTATGYQDPAGPCYVYSTNTVITGKFVASMRDISSVDVVFTSDKSKWTRSVVIEEEADPALAEGHVDRFGFRAGQSVDKDGNPAPVGSGPSNNPDDPNYISETGMGWFPGYAINIETGERLNIMFGEDSWDVANNGRDMLFNPTSALFDPIDGRAIFGGKHYVYIMDHLVKKVTAQSVFEYDFSAYDACKYIRNVNNIHELLPSLRWVAYAALYGSCTWIGMPLSIPGKEWLNNDATIRIRVAKPYQRYYSMTGDSAMLANSQNRDFPLYRFETQSTAAEDYNAEKAKRDLDQIKVVPNPYYAYAGGPGYEANALDNQVKITNLPEQCTITIYNVKGIMIRQYTKDEPKTSINWDLKNFAGVPIAGGVYIIHIKSKDGEKIVKWFGGLRPPDLNVF